MSIPAYPVIHVEAQASGDVRVNVAGRHKTFTGGRDRATDEALSYAADFARELGRGVRLHVVDADGEYDLVAHPSGEVTADVAPAKGRRGSRRPPPAAAAPAPFAPDHSPKYVAVPPAPPAPSMPAGDAPSMPAGDAPSPAPPSPAGGAGELDPAERTRLVQRRIPAADPPTATLVDADSGQRIVVDERAVLGRRPTSGEQYAGWERVTISDRRRTVSRVHATIERTERGYVVTDLGSVNGTRLQRGDADAATLTAHTPVRLVTGDVLEFGDGLRFRVAIAGGTR